MKRYLYWSGGKDSSASIAICHENGIQLDGIVFCEVMFDNARNISGENPKHIEWVYNTAIVTACLMAILGELLTIDYLRDNPFNDFIRRSIMDEKKPVDPAKERVEKELEELNEKIVKLSSFLYGKKLVEAGLSFRIRDMLNEQLRTMQRYAEILQNRLAIWGKTDEELCKAEKVCGCY